ncbi:MAG TPA: exodeoxyribonuclease VII large subunit, partial [Bryobacteraceae bacterium]|nr:exodeoxyribonuclease VII large subunit [Bryobacteraceae bacterium]
RQRLDAATVLSEQSMALRLSRADGRLGPLGAHLAQLSPVKILERGYAIVQDEGGRILTEAEKVAEGAAIHIRLARGKLAATVARSES